MWSVRNICINMRRGTDYRHNNINKQINHTTKQKKGLSIIKAGDFNGCASISSKELEELQ